MMGGFGLWGMGIGMLLSVFFWVALVAGAVWLVARLFPSVANTGSAAGNAPLATPRESPLDIVKRRYASGEITRSEFEELRRDLEPDR